MPKYVVFTMDIVDQETHVVRVGAKDEKTAVELVLDNMLFCQHASAFTPDFLRFLADECEAMPPHYDEG